MQFRNSQDHYGLVALSFHWLTVALVIVAWLLRTFDDAFPRGAARAASLFVHMTAGLASATSRPGSVAGRRSASSGGVEWPGRVGGTSGPVRALRTLRTSCSRLDRRDCGAIRAGQRPARVRLVRNRLPLGVQS